jgi:hypothetical protein
MSPFDILVFLRKNEGKHVSARNLRSHLKNEGGKFSPEKWDFSPQICSSKRTRRFCGLLWGQSPQALK